jgi:hypothetical protein
MGGQATSAQEHPAIDQVSHGMGSSVWPATLQRPVDLPESLNPDCAAHPLHRRMARFDMGVDGVVSRPALWALRLVSSHGQPATIVGAGVDAS